MSLVIEINSVLSGSTGKIAVQLADLVIESGGKAYICVPKGRHNKPTGNKTIMIGNRISEDLHIILNRLTGYNGCFSYFSTKRFLRILDKIKPDILHLHNLHNCYINLPMLFNYIKKHNIPVVWTLHDTWAFTGQCPHFTMAKCDKWKTGCHHCPQHRQYPQSYVDRTKTMWKLKKEWFTGVQNMTIVTPSQWLADLVEESFLAEYPIKVINNGIDLNVFKPRESDFRKKYGLQNKRIVLGVAFGWGDRKGYADCLKLSEFLDDNYLIVLIGVSKKQIADLPPKVLGIERTNNQTELAEIYSTADVFINTTYEDNYPTVNLEARACGLPVITYKTGGSPESAGTNAFVVERGDILALKTAIEKSIAQKGTFVDNYDELSSSLKFVEYLDLYKRIVK